MSPEVAFLFDDGKAKSAEEVLARPDLEDTLGTYPRALVPSPPERRIDTGRIRHDALLRATYGHNARSVRDALMEVVFAGQPISVHKKVVEPLRRVALRLDKLREHSPAISKLTQNLGGGFHWRKIAGTQRLSAHSFGIAIDLNPKRSAYWRWSSAWDGNYERAVVELFESEGFIWGGAWQHFDSMHFEYRPELLDPECAPPVPRLQHD